MSVNFEHYVNYDHDTSPFESVIFGSSGTVLEVELNEMQDILITKLRTILKDIVGNSISNISGITYTDGTLSINNCIINANGYIVKCNNVSISASVGSNIYISILEEDVTKDSNLNENGYINGNIISNTIKDIRYIDETTRRKSIKYSIGTSEITGYVNVLLGTISNNGFTPSIISNVISSELGNKVDKVSGMGLSTNDYTTAEKNKVSNVPNDTNTALSNKVDKVTGKGLSTNDYTTAEKSKLSGIATSATANTVLDLTGVLTTTWAGTEAPYTQAVTVTGILATDMPIIDLIASDTFATAEAENTDWGKIYKAVTSANTITFYATEAPTVAMNFSCKVVR